MRDDFNKQLTERERIGHKMKFGDYRNAKLNKSLDEDMSGGKESIHARRRNAKGSNKARKQFNENLNPLKNFLRANLGRPWDKIYSEITQNFDKRKVINNHILEHLFQYVELEVYIIDGKPHTLSKFRYSDKEYSPITYSNPRWPTYYVDPRDGLLKTPKQDKTRRQRDRENELETEKKQAAVYRKIDEDNHLILLKGVWWHYIAKNKPAKVMEYNAPYFRDYEDRKAWNLLYESQPTEEAKQKLMVATLVDGPMPDKLDTPSVPGFADGGWHRGPRLIPKDKYFYSKQAASHKLLKQAGVNGMIPDVEPPRLSHRQASKYRNKKKESK